MQAGVVNGQEALPEVWCDKCANEGARRGSFTVTDQVTVRPCQRQGCSEPLAEMNKDRKK